MSCPTSTNHGVVGGKPSTAAEEDTLNMVQQHLANRVGLPESTVQAIARALTGQVVRMRGGWMFILYGIPMGVLRRIVWPGNEHPQHTGGAASVHTDQELDGDPLLGRSWILRWLLARKWIRIVNVWMPLGNMAVRPLCVMDTCSLLAKHQVRHRWLDHDGWFHTYGPEQEWWCHLDLGLSLGDAIFFDTIRSPHGAATLSGEVHLKTLRLALVGLLNSEQQSNKLNAARQLIETVSQKCDVLLQSCERRALQYSIEEIDTYNNTIPAPYDQDTCLLSIIRNFQRHSVEARAIAVGPFSPLMLLDFIHMGIKSVLTYLRGILSRTPVRSTGKDSK